MHAALPETGLIAAITMSAAVAAAVPATAPQNVARELAIDYERSMLVAKTGKAGLLRFLGHEHGIVPGSWSAQVRFDPEDLAGSSIAVEVDAGELVIDSERARRLAGIDPGGPDEKETAEIQADMLSAKVLDVAAFPQIRFRSSSLRRDSPSSLHVEGRLEIHGVEREVAFDADLEPDGEGWVMRGGFEIGQRDFGMEPVSIGGVVKVADEVGIAFEVFATPR
jgi:polyisoprenoid-binding protein YceI